MTDQTCEERIGAHLADREEDLEAIFAVIDGDSNTLHGEEATEEEGYQALDLFPLAAEIRSTLVVQISTGGPGDQFEIPVHRGSHGRWELADSEATYRFLDWFDGATRRTDNPAVMRMLENFIEVIE